MKPLSDFLAVYKNRIGRATIFEGHTPKEATVNHQYYYDYSDSDVSFNTYELFEESLYKEQMLNDSSLWISPCSYRTNRRTQEYFKSTSFLGVDYDDGLSISECSKQLDECRLSYIIYTTKNHQKVKETDSGKKKPACDRFRVFIPISKDILTNSSLFQFSHAIKSISPFDLSDTVCFESARMFHLYPYGEVFFGKNKYCLDTDKLIEIGKTSIKKVSSGHSKSYISIDDKQLVFEEGNSKIDKYLIRSMQKYFDGAGWTVENTHQKIFGCICWAFNKNSDWNIVYNSLREWKTYTEWLLRHPNKEIKKLISKCFHVVYGDDIKAKNEVKTYSEADLSISLDYAENCLLLRDYRNMARKVSTTDMLLEKAMNDEHKRIIIQSPCGGGKSTAAIAYMATYSEKDAPIWYVAETRNLCEKTKTELEGIYKSDVGYLQGFDPKQCPKAGYLELPDGEGFHLEGIDSTREPYRSDFCNGCTDKSICNFFTSRRSPKTILSKPTVIMTHKKLINLFQKSNIPSNVRLIIDEELKRWENYSFTHSQFNTFKRKVGDHKQWDDVKLSDEYEQFTIMIESFMSMCVNNAGVELKYLTLSNELSKHLYKVFSSKERDELEKQPSNYQIANKYDMLHEFIRFFSNNSLKYMRFNIQYIDSTEVEAYDCSTDAIQFNIPNKTIILNASAQFSHVEWEDFTIYKLDEELDFSNTTYYCILANATKRRIMEGGKFQKPLIDTILKQADNVIKKKNIKDIFLATDKKSTNDKVEKFRAKHELKNHNIVNISRGNIQSNNSARGCEIAIVTMANFTTVSDYLLKTAMANGERIDADRFVDHNGNMKIHKGFDDEQIDEEATRQMIDEIYQTVMRGNIRSDNQNKYEVIVVLTPKLMIEMMKLFPNAKFESVDKELKALIDLNEMSEDELNDLSETDKDKVFYKTRNKSKMKKRDKLVKLIRKLKK